MRTERWWQEASVIDELLKPLQLLNLSKPHDYLDMRPILLF
jgi:hypothetical protein